MLRANETRDDSIREDVPHPQARHARIQPLDVRHAAAEYDHVGIEHVDDAGKRASHSLFVGCERRLCLHIAAACRRDDLWRRLSASCLSLEIGGQAWAGQKCLDAAVAAAIT